MGRIAYIIRKFDGAHPNSTLRGKFYGAAFLATPISENDLNDLISQDSQIERSEVAVVTDAICKQIKELVCNGHSIKVGTLGTFSLGLKSKAVVDAKKVSSENVKSARLRLRASQELKNNLKAVRIEYYNPAIDSI